jgi:hypothetical protein
MHEFFYYINGFSISTYSLRLFFTAYMLPKIFLLFFYVLHLCASLLVNRSLEHQELNTHEAGGGRIAVHA